MLQHLQAMDYFCRYKTHISGDVTHLFFAHPKSIELFKRYPEILLLDCTYNTNRFNMPLLNIMGTTALGTSFFVSFAFLTGETNDDYLWVIKELKTLIRGEEILDPSVVVTDCELALINALKEVFLWSQNLLCEWHISKAVLTYIKHERIFKSMVDRQEEGWKEDQEKEQEDKFLACFSSLIASPSESIYQSQLDRLLKSYEQYNQLLQYLINIWITPWVSNFIRCYADQHYHFGNRATSRIEGGHSILKTYL